MICNYRHCDKELPYRKKKYCCIECTSRENSLIRSDQGKLRHDSALYQLRSPVEVTYHLPVRKYIHDVFTDSDKWTQIGLSSSVEAMEEVIKMLK